MYKKAEDKLNSNIRVAKTWEEFMFSLNQGKVLKTPWCEREECEENVKRRSGEESKIAANEDKNLSGSAKTLCIPFDQEKLEENAECFVCRQKATKYVLWGRSY